MRAAALVAAVVLLDAGPAPAQTSAAGLIVGAWHCASGFRGVPTRFAVRYAPDRSFVMRLDWSDEVEGRAFSVVGEVSGTWALAGDVLTETITEANLDRFVVEGRALPTDPLPPEVARRFVGVAEERVLLRLTAGALTHRDARDAVTSCARGTTVPGF